MDSPGTSPSLPLPPRRGRAGLVDTSRDAQHVLTEVYRSMPPERKWHWMRADFRLARQLHHAGYLRRHPDATPCEVRRDWLGMMFGDVPDPSPGAPEMNSPDENLQVIREVLELLDRLGVTCALGGSLASGYHGESRQTGDADVTIEPVPGLEHGLTAGRGPAYHASPDAIREALRTRSSFSVIQTIIGFKIGFYLRGDRPFDAEVMARRQPVAFPALPNRPVWVISPEDSILLKLEWYRLGVEVSDRQWTDVLGVLRVQSGRLDEAYLDRWAGELGVADLLAEARAEAAA